VDPAAAKVGPGARLVLPAQESIFSGMPPAGAASGMKLGPTLASPGGEKAAPPLLEARKSSSANCTTALGASALLSMVTFSDPPKTTPLNRAGAEGVACSPGVEVLGVSVKAVVAVLAALLLSIAVIA